MHMIASSGLPRISTASDKCWGEKAWETTIVHVYAVYSLTGQMFTVHKGGKRMSGHLRQVFHGSQQKCQNVGNTNQIAELLIIAKWSHDQCF